MEKLIINGKCNLGGEISIHGSKNSALPILAASVLINGVSTVHNCPDLSDINVTIEILRHLGAKVSRQGSTLVIDSTDINNSFIPENMMQEMRSSIIFLGSLSARTGNACLFLPGGCDIGLRPIDLHLKSLEQLGYEITFDGHNICSKKSDVHSQKIILPIPSVGATENIILASVLIKGKTTILNSACEPEIKDLADFLNKAGANIQGAGTSSIVIDGVSRLYSTEHTVIPDRILAATMMSASAITSSPIRINNISPTHLMPVFPVFDEMGCKIYLEKNALTIKPPSKLHRVKRIQTKPYPGFPTDCQAPVMASLTVARGTSVIIENIFENRFKHISRLNRLGADVIVNNQTAVINGVKSLHSADVSCTDLRGGAAIVLAALAAEGRSQITDIHHIDRGYEKIENQLSSIGADIKRINDEKAE